MIEIIPLDFNNEEYISIIEGQENIETNSSYITSITLLSTLIKETTFPIKNRYIAMENILTFMCYIDSQIKRNKNTIIPIPRIIIDHYFSRDTYKKYMDYLDNNQILTKVPYNDGKFYDYSEEGDKKGRCIQYRVHNKYMNDDLCIAVFPKENNIKLETDKKYNNKLEKTILKTEINYREAILDEIKNYRSYKTDIFTSQDTITKGINSLRCRISAILSLNNKRYIRKGDKVDRVYHSFSNLSRISRKHLNHSKGKCFYSLDITNCQPLLLCYYMKTVNEITDDSYIKACEDGKFYETLMDEEHIKTLRDTLSDNDFKIIYEEYRNDIKEQTYKYIYFNFNKQENIVKKFANLYTNTYYFLSNFYESTPEITMASNLQNIEASVFNSIIPNKSKYYFTLFDAIYFSDYEDSISIQLRIEEMFSMLGLKPKLK